MPAHQRLGTEDRDDLQDRRKPLIHLDEEPAIVVRKLGPVSHLASQNHQLTSEHRILGLKPALRLERRSQDGQNKPDQRDHCANLAGSVAPSTRIRFSVHTAVATTWFPAFKAASAIRRPRPLPLPVISQTLDI